MSEQNIVNVMVIPDVPKVLPGEQLYVYVPKASFTFPGIIAYNNTQFRIDGNFLFIREDYVSPGVQQKIDELKQYTDDELQLKQDKEDNNISLAQRPEQKSVVGAINDLGTLTGQAQDTADDAIRKIGDLSKLTTDEKTTIVGAINEVDAHADANKSEIGTLSALTTDEKATLVGAINEVDAHTNTAQQAADAAQATADNATTLANTGISKADRAQATANTAVDKANDAKATANEAIMKADGRSNSIGFMTAKDAVTALNGYPRTQLKGGDTIWIVETGTPDLWVTEVAQESVPYNYTTKDKFNQDLVDNKVLQIGYFKTAYQESDGKPVTIAWQNVLVKSTDWVASTEFADFPYEAKIELTDFVDYTTVPQVVFDIADTMSGNYAPICKSGDKCVYIYGKVQDEITLKTVITFAPNVNGASITGGGYNNRGKWQSSTTYEIDDLVYTDNGQYVCIDGITSTTSPEQDTQHWQATFIATGKTKNGLTISGQDNGTGVQKTFNGSTPVEVSFDETTMTTKEVNGVLKVGAKGTIPEALPQTAGALKSGNLPIDSWNMFGEGWLQNSLPTNRAWRTVTYGDSKFVALAKDAAYGAYSTDGISWGEMTLPASREWWTATYGNGKFVAIAQNSDKGAYSTDGITWTEMTLPASRAWRKVAYGDGKFVAVASSSDKGAYSTDGTNWTEMTFPASRAWYGVTYGNGKFVAVASGINKGAYSTDGITWTDMTLPASNMSDVTYGDGKFVAISSNQTYNGAYSTDGVTWIETTSSAGRSGSSVTYGDGKFVAISWDIQNATYSTDGIHWNAMTMPVRAYWATITYGNGKFVAVAQSSPNGAYWNAANAQVSYTISDTDVTVNSDVLMELTDEGMVKANALANGSIQVIRDRVPTIAIPYTYKVKQTNAAGQFTLVNHYIPDVPDVPDAPTALPQETSTIKSGSLPTSGWTRTGVRAFWQGNVDCPSGDYEFIGTSKALADILFADDSAYMIVDYNYFYGGYYNKKNAEFSYKKSNAKVNGLTGISFRAGYNDFEPTIFISRDGKMYGKGMWQSTGHYDVTYTRIGASTVSQQIYSISDSSITINGDILMELTDEGGVKAYSMEAGKITVIRDTVPTAAIPYTYKVKQTNTSGQFTLVNHFVPTRTSQLENDSDFITKADIPFIPTRTSELENDSAFVSNLPTVQDVVCNDVNSATTLDTTITCEVGDLILAQIIVRSALTLPTDWTLLRTIPAVETSSNQTLSFAYKRATSTSETLTVTQATAERIYTNLVRLSNAVSISYIQSCEKTGTGIKSISSTKPVTSNMVIWGASSVTWNTSSPYGNWSSSPSTLDYYSLSQSTKAPRLGTFIDRSGTGTRKFTIPLDSSNAMMCGAVEIVGDEVARKGDIPTIPTKTSQLENDSNFAKTNTPNSWGSTQTFTASDGIKTNRICNAAGTSLVDGTGTTNKFGNGNMPTIIKTSEARPKAEVPYADGTATREIALLEDIPSMVIDWVGPSATEQVITGTGMRQIFAEFTDTVGDVSTLYKFYGEVYVDGQNEVNGTSSTVYSTNTEGTELHVITVTPTIRRNTNNEFVLRAECCRYTIGASPMSINKSYLSFVFRRRLY